MSEGPGAALTQALRPFHLALPVHDLAQAQAFYGELLGCACGRASARWLDFDFFGHQLTVHLTDTPASPASTNPVDGEQVPASHFGVILTIPAWDALAARLTAAGTAFLIAPTTRFAGSTGEQRTMFFRDPSGNPLEFKAFADDRQIFATD
ncbi:MAG: VOC family protein [Pseudomonadota bacterium]